MNPTVEPFSKFLRSPAFHYWIHECKITGDVWEEPSFFEGVADALVGLENWRNGHVDGRYDLINLFPVAISAEPFLDAWCGSGDVNVKIRCLDGDDALRFTLADVGHSDAGSVRTAPRSNVAGQPLHSATMDWLANSLTISSVSPFPSVHTSIRPVSHARALLAVSSFLKSSSDMPKKDNPAPLFP